MKEDKFREKRIKMVDSQIRAKGVLGSKVLKVMEKVPRHCFIPENVQAHSYADEPLPIGKGQTISQPYIVAYMTDALNLDGSEKILEIGTGSGYQTAILAEIGREIYTVEVIELLATRAKKVLSELNYTNIQFKLGDGNEGWDENALYDAILVTAAPPKIPEKLLEQLKMGGRMILPVGVTFQELVYIEKLKKKIRKKKLLPVRFVPLVSMD